MKSYAETHRSNGGVAAALPILSILVGVVALAGCSPAASADHGGAEESVLREVPDPVAENASEEFLSDETAAAPGLPLAETPKELLEWIARGDFEQREQVAAGRFLRDFEDLAPIVDNMDRDQLRAVSWGARTSRLEAPVKDPLDLSPAGTASLRVVKREHGWKLEHVVVRQKPGGSP